MIKGTLILSTIIVGLLLTLQVVVFAQSPTATQSAVSPSPAVRVPSGAPATGHGI